MFELSELISLTLFLVGLPIVLVLTRSMVLPGRYLFSAGYMVLLVARIATVAEGIMWYQQNNLLEHTCYALACGFFLLACVRMRLESREQDE